MNYLFEYLILNLFAAHPLLWVAAITFLLAWLLRPLFWR